MCIRDMLNSASTVGNMGKEERKEMNYWTVDEYSKFSNEMMDKPLSLIHISVEWLEDFLRNYSGAFIVISHDRYFLDRVTNKTFELENGRFRSYNGNYSAYMLSLIHISVL